MIKELGDLNEKFYQLYGRLHKNKSLLAVKPEQLNYIATALFNQYKAEYKLLVMRTEIRERRALYDAELRHYMLVPRKRFFFFRNRAMKQLDAEILDKLEAWFEERENNAEGSSSREDLPLGWESEPPAQSVTEAAPEQPAEQNEQAATPEQSAALPETAESKNERPTAQSPEQLSLLNE